MFIENPQETTQVFFHVSFIIYGIRNMSEFEQQLKEIVLL